MLENVIYLVYLLSRPFAGFSTAVGASTGYDNFEQDAAKCV